MGSDARLATIAKNSAEDVVIALTEFHGHQLVDVRVYTRALDDGVTSGEKHATKKGIALKVGLLRDLIAGLRAAEIEAVRRGLLDAGDVVDVGR